MCERESEHEGGLGWHRVSWLLLVHSECPCSGDTGKSRSHNSRVGFGKVSRHQHGCGAAGTVEGKVESLAVSRPVPSMGGTEARCWRQGGPWGFAFWDGSQALEGGW